MTSTPAQPSLSTASAAGRDAATSHDHAAAHPAPPLTLQNYLRTLFWTFAAMLFCAIVYAVEKYGLIRWLGVLPNDSLYRMFKNPAELPMRVFGLPHIIIATLFLLSSRRMKGVRSYGWLAGLGALSVVFCYAFWRVGAHNNGLALLVFYAYFLVHGFRDEAFFYKTYGDMPKENAAVHQRIVGVLGWLLLGLILALIIPAYQIYAQQRPEFSHPAIRDLFPAQWPYVLRFLSLIGPMGAVALFALWRIARVFPDGLRGLWRVHAPIIFVFGVSTFIVLLALVSGPWSFNAVVLMHFVGWYLFGRWMIRRHDPTLVRTLGATGDTRAITAAVEDQNGAGANAADSSSRRVRGAERNAPSSAAAAAAPIHMGLWKWMRTTVKGFTVLHLGLAAVVVVLIAISTYFYGKGGVLEDVVGSKSFYYWTIVHVTLSFFPR